MGRRGNAQSLLRRIQEPQWQEITDFQNSWSAFTSTGLEPTSFIKLGGWVFLRGGVTGGSTNTVAFTMQEGYRPAALTTFICHSHNANGHLDVLANGDVCINVLGPGPAIQLNQVFYWVGLTGVPDGHYDLWRVIKDGVNGLVRQVGDARDGSQNSV